jgi:hypothetical protein
MHLQVCGEEEKGRNTRVWSLASPHLARWGGVWRGEARRGEPHGCMT